MCAKHYFYFWSCMCIYFFYFLYLLNGVCVGIIKWSLYHDRMWGVCVWGGGWMCGVNIVNPAVDWPPLLHTLTDCDKSWSGWRLDVPTHVTWLWPPFDLWPWYRELWVNTNSAGTYFTYCKNSSSTFFFKFWLYYTLRQRYGIDVGGVCLNQGVRFSSLCPELHMAE